MDRQSMTTSEEVVASEPCDGEVHANCHGAFNRKEKKQSKRKTKTQIKVLMELYNCRPKLRAEEMHEEMRRMRHGDGGLLFSNRRKNTTGGCSLLTRSEVGSLSKQETTKMHSMNQLIWILKSKATWIIWTWTRSRLQI